MAHRDDLQYNDQYPVASAHSEEAGQKTRKTILQVTILLSVVTMIEVALGVYVKQGTDLWAAVKWVFIALTLLKAFYIVFEFMHLGHETPLFKRLVIFPYIGLIGYLLTLLSIEGLSHALQLPSWL